MAYPHPYLELSWGGETADGNEIWSNTIHLIGDSGAYSDPEAWLLYQSGNLDDAGAVIEAFIGNSAMRVPNNTKVYWCKLAAIDTTGHYITEPVLEPLDWGGAVNAPFSPQDAMVVTLVSDVWRGAGRYNRFFLPTAGPAGTNAWAFSTAEQEAFAAAASAFVTDLNEAFDSGLPNQGAQVGVVSPTGTGHYNPAISVMVGQIVDTQRRRRNKLNENYLVEPIT